MDTDDYLQAQPIVKPSETVKSFTPKLTRKQAAFVKEIVDNPKRSATEAASKVYDVANRDVARSMAAENLAKPSIIMALGEHSSLVESVLVGTVKDWGRDAAPRKREIALDAAKFVHDKIHGKATVKIQAQTEVVSININLTGDNEQPPDELL